MPELERWVWTTFNAYQWDLDYSNPEVFLAMAEAMLGLAAAGVDVLRLDAAPFLWKRKGTNCQNQPEVHELLQAFRALMRIAAPAVAFKAEAIVSPRDLVGYLGAGRHEGKECDLAYHNVLMVLLWSALASGRVALMTHTLRAMPPVPPGAGWVTYVRCHDDIGWAITEEDAGAVGEDGYLHRRFLADFYAGEFPGSFARGARFQPDPRTGEARTSGTAASLAGLEAARASGDALAEELAIRRILLLYALALRARRPAADLHGRRARAAQRPPTGRRIRRAATTTAGCIARRWTGRRRSAALDPATVEGRLWDGLRRLIAARRATRAIHAQGRSEPLWTGNDHVFGLLREHAGERLLVLANFTAGPQHVDLAVARDRGLTLDPAAAQPDGRTLELTAGGVLLRPYQHAWLSARGAGRDTRS